MVTQSSSPVPAIGSQPIYHPLADPLIQTDEQLMLRVQQRSLAALETLYARYADAGVALAFQILGDRDLAEQVLVEAFWHIWSHPYQDQWGRGRFSDLFSGIIWHLALDKPDYREMRPLPHIGAYPERMLEQHQQGLSSRE